MKKLADISAFEGLQNQANMTIFNGDGDRFTVFNIDANGFTWDADALLNRFRYKDSDDISVPAGKHSYHIDRRIYLNPLRLLKYMTSKNITWFFSPGEVEEALSAVGLTPDVLSYMGVDSEGHIVDEDQHEKYLIERGKVRPVERLEPDYYREVAVPLLPKEEIAKLRDRDKWQGYRKIYEEEFDDRVSLASRFRGNKIALDAVGLTPDALESMGMDSMGNVVSLDTLGKYVKSHPVDKLPNPIYTVHRAWRSSNPGIELAENGITAADLESMGVNYNADVVNLDKYLDAVERVGRKKDWNYDPYFGDVIKAAFAALKQEDNDLEMGGYFLPKDVEDVMSRNNHTPQERETILRHAGLDANGNIVDRNRCEEMADLWRSSESANIQEFYDNPHSNWRGD